MKPSFPLRFSVPVSLVLLAVVLTALAFVHDWLRSYRTVEELTLRRAAALGNVVVPTLERALARGDSGEDEIARLAVVPHLSRALVCDAGHRVLFATEFALRDRRLEATPAASARHLLTRARETMSAQFEISPGGASVEAAFPFYLGLAPGELHPTRTAVLYTRTDLVALKAEALANIVERSLVMGAAALLAALAVWAYLHAVLTRRVSQLVQSAVAYAAGQTDVRAPAGGKDELARIGQAFNRMITELSADDAALRAGEARLRMALDAARMCTFEWDVVRNQITWSGRREQLWGLPDAGDASTYESFAQSVHAEDRPGLVAEVQRCLAERRPCAHEFRLVWPDGSIHWVGGTGEFTFAADGQPVRLHGVLLEVTQRRLAEEALRASEAETRSKNDLLTATLANIVDGVIVVDADEQIRLVNITAASITGWPAPLAVGRPLSTVLTLRDASGATLPSPMKRALETGGAVGNIHSLDAAVTLADTTGNRHKVVLNALPIFNQDLRHEGGLIVFRDVTHELEVEQMRVDFVRAVSHELRTPLTSIRGFIATLQRDPDLPLAERTEFLTIVEEQALRLSRLVDDILEISRVESGLAQYHDAVVDWRGVLDRSLREVQTQAEGKGLQIAVACDPALPPFRADPARLQSLLTNLLGNAVKFTPARGRVDLSVAHVDGGIRIAVKDTGIGIPAGELDRIFENFYRVHRPGVEVVGTGLGLALVKAIATHYGGRIEVESQPNAGSCFRVFLPLNPARNREAG